MMKNLKKIIISILFITLGVCKLFTIDIMATTSGDWEYTSNVNESDSINIHKYLGTETEVIIPSELDGKTVTSIGKNQELTSIFGDTKVTSVVIPDTVVTIGQTAFKGCSTLTEIEIPNSVKTIGAMAFYTCTGLKKIELPNSVTSIGGVAFFGCTGVTELKLSSSITSIGEYAFQACDGLTEIVIPEGVTEVSTGMFFRCEKLRSISIPSSVSRIGDYAFGMCLELKDIKLSNGLKQIEEYAFVMCSNLEEIRIPKSVTTIVAGAFASGSALKSIEVDSGNQNFSMKDGILYSKDTLLKCLPTKEGVVKIPKGIILIEADAFEDCYGISKVEVPDTVTEIGQWAFGYCTGLKEIQLPDTIKKIGDYAFSGCSGLTQIELPKYLTHIGEEAFRNCTGLVEITIPTSVTGVGSSVFQDCTSLKNVNLYNNITIIPSEMFQDCGQLTSITIPNSVTKIECDVFVGCTELTSAVIPSSVTEIARTAFGTNSKLVIYCEKNTTAHEYAVANEIPFVILEPKQMHTVTFDGTEGTDVTIPSMKVETGTAIKGLPTATRGGYKLKGWYTAKTGGQKISETTIVAKDMTVYAQWAKVLSEKDTTIKLSTEKYTYNGTERKPKVVVKFGGVALEQDLDYTVSYQNHIKPGTAKVIINGIGNYSGTYTRTFIIIPAKVTSLKQTTIYSSASIKMSWTKAVGVSGYTIYRAVSKNGTYSVVKAVTTNSYTHTGIKSGSKYYYKVRAYKLVNGKKIYGAYSEAKSMITKPAVPNITLKAGSKCIKISWSKCSGANGYEVYMSGSKNGSYTRIKHANSLQTSYTKYGLKKGKTYYLKVRAYKKTGVGVKVYTGYSSIQSVTVK